MKNGFSGSERREFVRIECAAPFAYKVCKKITIAKLLDGYASNISPAGLLCTIKDKVRKQDILWLALDRGTLAVCSEAEKRTLIYQNGIIGKVVRVEAKKNGVYDVGVQFITREEKNLSHIYPKVYFLDKGGV